MYKQLLLILMMLVMLCMGTTVKASGTYTDAEGITWICVSTAQEFSDAIIDNHDANYVCSANIRLMNDIKLQSLHAGALGSDNYLFDVTFSGRITSDAADDYYVLSDTQHTLFRELNGANIKQIFIAQSSFNGRDTSSGMLADDCNNTTLENIYFYEISATGNSGGYDCDRMGIAVGKAVESHFNDLFFIDCQLITDGEAAGFVCGSATSCSFAHCITSVGCCLWADGNSACPIIPGVQSNAYAGGICGYADTCTLLGCINLGIVSSDDDRIGGIIGHGKNTTVTDCRNAGVVKHCTQVGFGRESRIFAQNVIMGVAVVSGILATASAAVFFNTSTIHKAYETFNKYDKLYHSGQGLTVNNVVFDLVNAAAKACVLAEEAGLGVGTLIAGSCATILAAICAVATATAVGFDIYDMASKPDEMGGIAGKAEAGSQILRCVNSGAVVCADVECGGIVGYLAGSSIENCYNQGIVRGQGETAGIAGYIDNGKVLNCLNTGRVTNFDGSGYYGITGVEKNVASGGIAGNYYLYDDHTDHGTAWSFTQADLASGWVAKQMNDNLGENPIWRQTIAAEGGDFYPNMDEASGRPLVTSVAAEGGYSIVQKVCTGSQFMLAASNPNAQIVLENDIDLSGLGFLLSDYYNPFKGTIDGQGHKLANFAYESSRHDYRKPDRYLSTEVPHHIALFPYTADATIKNLVIDNFHITQRAGETKTEFIEAVGAWTEGLLVGASSGSTFTNIRVRNSDILLNSDQNRKWNVGGLIATANQTYITDCTIESSCRFESYCGLAAGQNAYLGGFVGTASNTLFTRCHNDGELWAEDEYVGGICGHASGCGFVSCLNSGEITGEAEVGGIVGYAGSCDLVQCVNTVTIYGDKQDSDNDHIGGIVGMLEDNASHVKYCLNFGDLAKTDGSSENGAIIGAWKNFNFGEGNYVNNLYYYSHNNTRSENLSDFGYSYADVLSGKFAYQFKAANDGNKQFLYQSLDNDPFCTKLPVPIATAGEVFYNLDCNGNLRYSNIFKNTNDHPNDHSYLKWGFCTKCGEVYNDHVPTALEIASAADLMTLSRGVRMGVDYTTTTITLANDLDFEGVTGFMPIGTSIERPFRGTFNGNGHRIKNLHIERTSNATGVGLFGVVTGQTRIQGVIMDQSCSVDGNGSLGVGGLVGCLMTSSTSDSGTLLVYNCGNEATVQGGENVAGLVGGVYDKANDGAATTSCALRVSECYNAGTIIGNKISAALVGYGHLNIETTYSYNIGIVSGYIEGDHMVHYNKEKATHHGFVRLYQLEGLPGDVNLRDTVTAQQFVLGDVAEKLNYSSTTWGQNLGTDIFPTPTGNGKTIYHERPMSRDWGTAILPYNVQSDDDVQLYAMESTDLTSTDASITLKAVECVAANAPFFFKKKNSSATSVSFNIAAGNNVTLPADNAASVTVETDVPGWSLTGTYTGESDLKDVYFMAQDQLWFADDAIEVPGFRSYLTYEAPQTINQASLRILVNEEGESTQIGEIRDGELHFYDDGKYLENGRVVIRKGGKTYGAQGQLLKY